MRGEIIFSHYLFFKMSLLNTKDNFIHIHIPKTAGTSLRQILGGGGHTAIKEFHAFITCNTDIDWDSLFKFTFVRNPWDRMISCMFHGPTPDYKFDHVLDELLEAKEKDDWSEHGIFKPQHFYTHLKNGIYKEGKGLMNFIGRFENLQLEWNNLAGKLGVASKLSHKNKGTHKPSKEYLTKERLRKTKEIYRRDYELFYSDMI